MKRRVIKTICGAVIVGAVPAAWADTPCQWCGPAANWINSCTVGGNDVISESEADVGIYLSSDCSGIPASFRVLGPVTIRRESSHGSDTIVTEIVSMNLTGGGLTLLAGTGAGLTRASPGTIVEAGNNTLGNSSFNVYFKAIGWFGTVWNHVPLFVTATITCVPPRAEYIHPQGQCIPLYAQEGDGGTPVAYLGNAVHITYPSGIPTVSEWGLVIMTLIGLALGTVFYGRRRVARG